MSAEQAALADRITRMLFDDIMERKGKAAQLRQMFELLKHSAGERAALVGIATALFKTYGGRFIKTQSRKQHIFADVLRAALAAVDYVALARAVLDATPPDDATAPQA